jgi:hypothetical protein
MKPRGSVPLTLGVLLLAGSLRADTHQDFDNPGSPFLLCQHLPGAPGAVIRDPAAIDFSGRFLRLATFLPENHNSAVFEIEDPGACRRDLDLEFDFRITPQTPMAADGIGVALLRRSRYQDAKCVAPEDPLQAAEEPNFAESLGIGFDVHQAQEDHDRNDNHVSIHYDNGEIGEFEIKAGTLDLSSSDWIHARILIRAAGADSRLTVILKPKGEDEALTVVDGFLLKGFQLYPWRLRLAARSGGLASFHDIDNVHVVASGCPQLDGRWDPAPLSFPSPDDRALAIHSHLLPTGQVMFWDRHDRTPPGEHMPLLWDPVTGALDRTGPLEFDAFCSGHAFRADGRLFVAGGHIEDQNGEKRAASYDPITNTWEEHLPMTNGRWYPTVTTLADGSLLAVAGSYFDDEDRTIMNNLPEVFNPATGAWRPLTTARRVQPYYPFMFLAPNGKVLDAGPQTLTRYLDTSGTGDWSFVAISRYGHRDYGSAAMYRPGKVILLGGSPPDPFPEPPTNSTEVIDLAQDPPRWEDVPPMAFARRQHTAILLPDGALVAFGGSSVRGFTNALGAVRHVERWDPDTRRWTTLAPMQEARLYHSSALLLPDGRVFVAGGGHPSDGENGDLDHFEAEIYSPPYLFAGPRPILAAAPNEITYGELFGVKSPHAAEITGVSLVRLGAVTHGFDQNQRFLTLEFANVSGLLRVRAPAAPELAPPGHYLLFILRNGVPSVGRIVRIGQR